MNAYTTFLRSTKKNLATLLGGVSLAVITLISLYAFEVAPMTRFASQEALAWHCESMTASPETITLGGSSALSWVFAADENIWVTIEGLPGGWDGYTGSTEVSPTQTTTYTAVAHQVGSETTFECSATVTVVTPPDEPRVPACPFVASDNVTVIDFNSGKKRSDLTLLRSDKAQQYEIEKTTTVAPGTYTIKTASWDGYLDRVNVTQPHEQWDTEIRSGTTVLGSAGPTTDLLDMVVEDTQLDTFTDAITFSGEGTSIAVVHAVAGDVSSPNSVVPVCVALVKKPVVEEPTCGMNANPTSIILGESSELSWTSTLVNSVSIPGVGTGLASASSTMVSPATTTTYTGTFYAKNGSELTCQATITVVPPNDNAPTCSMSVSSTKVKKGSSVTLNWSSVNTTLAVLNQGVGTTTLSGSKDFVVKDDMNFTGVFSDDAGKEVTCTAKVTVYSGGGKCSNCDDDDDDDPEDPAPKIVLSKTITKVGSYITLDQVPYTGFEAGPVLTTFFWLMVFALSVLIAYVTTRFRPVAWLRTVLSTSATNDFYPFQEYSETNVRESVAQAIQTPVYVAQVPTSQTSGSDAITIIEEMAHKENILLSPEALRLVYTSIKTIDESPTQYLTGIFAIAKSEYPQEDGWILLSKERAEKLLGLKQNNVVLNVTSPKYTASQPVEVEQEKPFRIDPVQISRKPVSITSSDMQQVHTAPAQTYVQKASSPATTASTDASVVRFVEALVNLKKKEVFDTLRTFTSQGTDVGMFITAVVRKLDEVYKHRIEGGHSPEKEIASMTATWSNGDFENVLGILVECIDYSYSNNHVGTKVALTKAFEHFERQA